jgi:hypothetical protein
LLIITGFGGGDFCGSRAQASSAIASTSESRRRANRFDVIRHPSTISYQPSTFSLD